MAQNMTNLFKLPFPEGGYNRGVAYDDQPRGTTFDCQNVRPWDPQSGRKRGAQRPGLARYLDNQAGGAANPIRDISQYVGSASGAISTTSLTNRSTTALAVAGGNIYTFTSSAFTTPTGGSGALSANAPVVFSAQLGERMYYCDGVNYAKWDSGTGAVTAWTAATAGTIPASGGNVARLIESWQGRIVMSGIIGDRRNYFMSAIFDAENWDYNPNPTLETQAIAGNGGPAGIPGDIINGMVPYSDDVLIFLCDHSVYELRGNPMAGGRLDLITDVVGGAYGRAWCKTDTGIVYFFGSRGGIYRMTPGSMPERITRDRIDEQLATVNLDTHLVRMGWDDRTQGMHVFISPLAAGATTHWFWDMRTDSWWPDVFADTNFNPLAIHQYDGDDPDDRVLMLGGRDGRIRYFSLTSKGDDTSEIDSYVFMGPLQMAQRQRVMIDEVHIALGVNSDEVLLTYHRGHDAEDASTNAEIHSRLVKAGRNYCFKNQLAGHSLFLKIRNHQRGEAWNLEYLSTRLKSFTGDGAKVF